MQSLLWWYSTYGNIQWIVWRACVILGTRFNLEIICTLLFYLFWEINIVEANAMHKWLLMHVMLVEYWGGEVGQQTYLLHLSVVVPSIVIGCFPKDKNTGNKIRFQVVSSRAFLGVSDFSWHIGLVYIRLLRNNVVAKMTNRCWKKDKTCRNMWRQRSFCASGCPAILLIKPSRPARRSSMKSSSNIPARGNR